jgi:hypothetical protein
MKEAPCEHLWGWDAQARDYKCALCDMTIAQLVSYASSMGEQRGRQQGVEEAARVCDASVKHWATKLNDDASYSKLAEAEELAALIRALAPLSPTPPPALPAEAVEKLVEKARGLVADVCEDFGRANFKFCNDSDYAGPHAERRHAELCATLVLLDEALAAVRATGGRQHG